MRPDHKPTFSDYVFDIRVNPDEVIVYDKGDTYLDEDGLTGRQREFVENYCSDPQHNLYNAMLKLGVPEDQAKIEIKKVMKKPVVVNAIKKRMAQTLNRHKITRDMIIEEYAAIAFARPSDFYTFDEEKGIMPISDLSKLNDKQKAAIAEFSTKVDKDTGKRYITKIVLHDKLRALEALGRYAGIFEKDNKQKISPTINIEDILNGIKATNPELEDMVRKQLAAKLLTDPDTEISQSIKH